MKQTHPHASFLPAEMSRQWYLFLLPVGRLLLHRVWSQIPPVSPADVLPAAWIVARAILRFRHCRYLLCPHALTVRQGILLRRTLYLPLRDAATAACEQTPLLRLCGGMRLRIGTAGLRRKTDASLYLSARQAQARLPLRRRDASPAYRAKIWPVLLLAFSGSNAAVGLLAIAPALHRIGSLPGRAVEPALTALLQASAWPFLLRQSGRLLMLGWLYSFCRSICRTANLKAWQEGTHLRISGGLFTRRTIWINAHRITALEIRQTLLMRLFRLQTVVITAAGYGRDAGTRPVLIPAAGRRQTAAALDRLLGNFPVCRSLLRPVLRECPRYLAAPLCLLAGGVPLTLRLPGRIGTTLCALLCVFCLWWLAVRFSGYRTAGFGLSRRAVSVRYCRGLALYEIHIPREVADAVIITRTPRQRRLGLCGVEVRSFGEKRRRYRVPSLPYDAVRLLLSK